MKRDNRADLQPRRASGVVGACLLVLLFPVGLVGCWSGQIKARAAFDLQCPEDQVEVTEISSFHTQYGVRGCGKQGTYIVRDGQAILNSPVTPLDKPAGPAAPASTPVK